MSKKMKAVSSGDIGGCYKWCCVVDLIRGVLEVFMVVIPSPISCRSEEMREKKK
jgi:hypothetical protein